ncbi:WPE palindromic element domain-containing protein [Wolbachia endosymbiont of Drosophila pseudotakahashii]|nr:MULTISPECIES: WPE palindromic element domain-containing protein [unclassified Wolbachia]UZE38823.1 WPE palindromic element domain-containing protein [Wolbachia endosymbiont of Drosophila pseudotakahashii]
MIQETKKDVIPVPRHWDPENFTLNEHTRWLYNRNWIPDWNDTIYYSNYLQIAMFVHQNAVSCCRFR